LVRWWLHREPNIGETQSISGYRLAAHECMNVEIANRQESLAVDEPLLRKAIHEIISEAGITSGEVSVAVVTDEEIHVLNRKHLEHDYPTDCLSFVFDRSDDSLDGEMIVSADTAVSTAAELDWPAPNELLLYVVHATLHLVGYDDKSDEARRDMRKAERRIMRRLGIELPADSVNN